VLLGKILIKVNGFMCVKKCPKILVFGQFFKFYVKQENCAFLIKMQTDQPGM